MAARDKRSRAARGTGVTAGYLAMILVAYIFPTECCTIGGLPLAHDEAVRSAAFKINVFSRGVSAPNLGRTFMYVCLGVLVMGVFGMWVLMGARPDEASDKGGSTGSMRSQRQHVCSLAPLKRVQAERKLREALAAGDKQRLCTALAAGKQHGIPDEVLAEGQACLEKLVKRCGTREKGSKAERRRKSTAQKPSGSGDLASPTLASCASSVCGDEGVPPDSPEARPRALARTSSTSDAEAPRPRPGQDAPAPDAKPLPQGKEQISIVVTAGERVPSDSSLKQRDARTAVPIKAASAEKLPQKEKTGGGRADKAAHAPQEAKGPKGKDAAAAANTVVKPQSSAQGADKGTPEKGDAPKKAAVVRRCYSEDGTPPNLRAKVFGKGKTGFKMVCKVGGAGSAAGAGGAPAIAAAARPKPAAPFHAAPGGPATPPLPSPAAPAHGMRRDTRSYANILVGSPEAAEEGRSPSAPAMPPVSEEMPAEVAGHVPPAPTPPLPPLASAAGWFCSYGEVQPPTASLFSTSPAPGGGSTVMTAAPWQMQTHLPMSDVQAGGSQSSPKLHELRRLWDKPEQAPGPVANSAWSGHTPTLFPASVFPASTSASVWAGPEGYSSLPSTTSGLPSASPQCAEGQLGGPGSTSWASFSQRASQMGVPAVQDSLVEEAVREYHWQGEPQHEQPAYPLWGWTLSVATQPTRRQAPSRGASARLAAFSELRHDAPPYEPMGPGILRSVSMDAPISPALRSSGINLPDCLMGEA